MSRPRKTSPAQMPLLGLPQPEHKAAQHYSHQERDQLPQLDEPCEYGKASQDEANCGGKPEYSRRAWTGPDPGTICCEAHWLEVIDDMLNRNASKFHIQGTNP